MASQAGKVFVMQERLKTGKAGLAVILLAACALAGGRGSQSAPAGSPPPRKPDVIYKGTPYPTVNAMLDVARVKKGEMVYDLGSGDGRIVIAAAKRYGARGVGVEIDPKLIALSNENARKAGVADRVRFVQQDLFTMDFKDADVVTLYLLPQLNRRLRPKMLRELRPGTRVVSHAFDMGDWKPDKTVRKYTVHYWVIPAQVAGTWQGTAAGGERFVLDLKQAYQTATGTLRLGNRTLPLTAARLDGDWFSATATAAGGAGQYDTIRLSGRVRGGGMQGSLEIQGGDSAGKREWTATRDGAAARPSEPAGGAPRRASRP